MAHFSILTIVFLFVLFNIYQGCTIPSGIRGAWISSEKNDLVFASSSLSGYQVFVFTTDNFTCIDTLGDYYLLKSESFSRFGLQFHAYLCLSFTEVSTNLYTYYKHSAEEVDANNERVLVKLSALPQATLSEACTVTNLTNVPYSLLLANGTIDSVKSTCPIPFLGDFTYTYDTGSGNLCTSGSDLTVCEGSKDTMTFNYTYCNQIQAYSAGGVVSCVYYTTDNNNVYTLHVYNQDATTDQSTTYRFTCYRAFGYGTVYATQYPGDCPSTMNYTYVASPGATLTLNASVVCAFSDDDDSTALSAGVIAAIAIICILIVIAIIAAIIYYFYMERKRRKKAEWEAANRKVDPDELSPNMRLGLPNESKYDLDRLMYSPGLKNGLIKRSPRKDMAGLEGLEGYNAGEKYINEDERQTALESQLFAEKRKRKDGKDEFNAAKRVNHIYSARVLDMAKGRKRPLRAAALAKIKLKPKARPMANTPDTDGRETKTKDILIQVEEADVEAKRKTRFADEEEVAPSKTPKPEDKKAKKLEDVETLSDIVDNENAVDDLSDDETKEPRLILPKLVPDKSPKKKLGRLGKVLSTLSPRSRKRRQEQLANKKKEKMIITRYIPFNKAPFIKRTVIFRPFSSVRRPKTRHKSSPPPQRPMSKTLPSFVHRIKKPSTSQRPKSKTWSALVRRIQKSRQNQVSPMPSVPMLRHKVHGFLFQRPKDRFFLGKSPQTPSMPHNTRFMPPKAKRKEAEEPEFTEPLPLMRSKPNLDHLPPLARIHRKDNPRAWKDAFGDKNGMESMDIETLKKQLPENRWRKLLEELYKDKKYFDYVKQSTSAKDAELFSKADESLQYLYGRALFWEQQEPVPVRPPSHVKRMYSRYDPPKSSPKKIQRSSTTMSRSSHRQLPRTPSTQVSKMKRRGTANKKEKDEANQEISNGVIPAVYFEGGTQTDFSPIPPLTPLEFEHYIDRVSLPGSTIDEKSVDDNIQPITKELTKSDIKLVEVDDGLEYFGDEEANLPTNEDVLVAV